MQTESRGFRYWGYLLVGILAFAAFIFIRNMGQQTILRAVLGEPGDLINAAMNSARDSPRITDRTGEITARHFKVENMSATKDTLIYRFLLDGERADATIKIWMTKRASNKWEIVKSDTLFISK
ncbi:hypothetical protein ACFST9_18985 [Hymenobacter monticola]|uniref:DUF4878 domain-containing protein n=1 Tax=Hymenobacter monticola TaxID=1705399 RepID=A0ABY4B2K5_9BACT|nr:hypothetical protein [Hymenobacter monticola]UOE32008.1 hypothetical protein MTP16_12780 [Hymenobacter monticola]